MYTLLIKAPCRIPTDEGSIYHYVGDVLEIEDDEYDFLEANFQNYYTVLAYTEPCKKQKAEKKVEKKVAKQEIESQEKKEIVVKHTANIPLSDDANWQEVKSYVLRLEEEVPINLEAVAGVKIKFSSYPSVVKECERILADNNVTVK